MSRDVKLVSVKKSHKPEKKWNFTFKNKKTGRTFTTAAGATGYQDYTQHHNHTRRKRYLFRHKKDLKTDDPTKAGYISYYVLWGPSTSFKENLEAYKKRFHL
jgi:Family of unknown function (DUF5754)